MTDGPTPAQWAELRTRRPSSDDALTTMAITTDGVETPLSMAMDVAGNLHLLIPVRRGPVGPKPPDLNGLKVRHRRLETGEFLDTLRGLMDQDYILSNKVNIRLMEDVEKAFFRVNPTHSKELQDAVNPSRKRERERAERMRRR